MSKKFVLVSLTAASMLLGLTQTSGAQQRNSEGYLFVGGLTKKQCRLQCQGMHADYCNMAYYWRNHPKHGPGVCEFTAHRNPVVNKRGQYAIYSKWLGKWLFRQGISTHWPAINVPPPPNTNPNPPKKPVAKLGAKPAECAHASARGQARWTFQSSKTTAWEINGYMCSGSSSGYYKVSAGTHEYYTCTSVSGGCTRDQSRDRLHVRVTSSSTGTIHYSFTTADGKPRTASRYEAYLVR